MYVYIYIYVCIVYTQQLLIVCLYLFTVVSVHVPCLRHDNILQPQPLHLSFEGFGDEDRP